MRDASETTWWRRTRQVAAVTVGGLVVLSLVPALLAGTLGRRLIVGLPLDMFLLIIVAPLAVLFAIFVFARQQQALDRRFDVAED